MRTLAPGRGGVGGHLVLPRGHLLVVARGCLEPLQRLVEAGPGLDGAVVAGAVRGVEVGLAVVGEVGAVRGGGGAVDLPAVGAVVGGAGGAGGTVVVTRGFVPRTEKTTSEQTLFEDTVKSV